MELSFTHHPHLVRKLLPRPKPSRSQCKPLRLPLAAPPDANYCVELKVFPARWASTQARLLLDYYSRCRQPPLWVNKNLMNLSPIDQFSEPPHPKPKPCIKPLISTRSKKSAANGSFPRRKCSITEPSKSPKTSPNAGNSPKNQPRTANSELDPPPGAGPSKTTNSKPSRPSLLPSGRNGFSI